MNKTFQQVGLTKKLKNVKMLLHQLTYHMV